MKDTYPWDWFAKILQKSLKLARGHKPKGQPRKNHGRSKQKKSQDSLTAVTGSGPISATSLIHQGRPATATNQAKGHDKAKARCDRLKSRVTSFGNRVWSAISCFNRFLRRNSTVAVAIFAGLQVWLLDLHWRAMTAQRNAMVKQNEQTESVIKQMQLEQRPWIAITSTVIKSPGPGKAQEAIVNLKNTGHTPGYIKSVERFILVEPARRDIGNDIRMMEQRSNAEKHDFVVAPDGVFTINLSGGKPVSHNALVAIAGGTANLFLIVKVVYADMNKKPHVTLRCFILDPVTQSLNAEGHYDRMD